MSEQEQISKGLKHLSGSEEIIGNIVAYCVNAHKADPSAATMDKIKQYVSDTANSVCGHVLTIAHNINSLIDRETQEIEEMAYQVSYAQHRLNAHQTFMSQLYMTKFQTLPRPKATIHVLRETIPTPQLPKFAKPKKPFVRSAEFNYAILDDLNGAKRRAAAEASAPSTTSSGQGEGGGGGAIKKQRTMQAINPTAAVAAVNPYENMMGAADGQPKTMASPSSPKTQSKSMFQIQKEKEAKAKSAAAKKVSSAAPPSFSAAAPPSFSSAAAAPPSFSAAPKKPAAAAVAAAGPPPPVPPTPPQPPKPPMPPQ